MYTARHAKTEWCVGSCWEGRMEGERISSTSSSGGECS